MRNEKYGHLQHTIRKRSVGRRRISWLGDLRKWFGCSSDQLYRAVVSKVRSLTCWPTFGQNKKRSKDEKKKKCSLFPYFIHTFKALYILWWYLNLSLKSVPDNQQKMHVVQDSHKTHILEKNQKNHLRSKKNLKFKASLTVCVCTCI